MMMFPYKIVLHGPADKADYLYELKVAIEEKIAEYEKAECITKDAFRVEIAKDMSSVLEYSLWNIIRIVKKGLGDHHNDGGIKDFADKIIIDVMEYTPCYVADNISESFPSYILKTLTTTFDNDTDNLTITYPELCTTSLSVASDLYKELMQCDRVANTKESLYIFTDNVTCISDMIDKINSEIARLKIITVQNPGAMVLNRACIQKISILEHMEKIDMDILKNILTKNANKAFSEIKEEVINE